MNIEFDKDLEGYQNALKLRQILGHCAAIETDQNALALIESLNQQINDFLSLPDFNKFKDVNLPEEANYEYKPSLLNYLSSFWHSFLGPSRRELILSKQRKELLERAEHAEFIAFEALAEAAEIKEERNQALNKLKAREEGNDSEGKID